VTSSWLMPSSPSSPCPRSKFRRRAHGPLQGSAAAALPPTSSEPHPNQRAPLDCCVARQLLTAGTAIVHSASRALPSASGLVQSVSPSRRLPHPRPRGRVSVTRARSSCRASLIVWWAAAPLRSTTPLRTSRRIRYSASACTSAWNLRILNTHHERHAALSQPPREAPGREAQVKGGCAQQSTLHLCCLSHPSPGSRSNSF